MSTSISIRRAVRCALLASATMVAASATSVFAAEGGTISEVIVTGSRIAQPNLTSVSPITTVSAEDVKIEGITRVEDLVNNLPQAFGEFGNNLANGATGTASVNLRGLGSNRTLVLVNGRRLMPGDPTQNGNATPDLNQIPAPLIERVEVLTGGASAVYGADAVGGVVNFIMNDNFEGVRLDVQYNVYQHENDSSIDNLVRARNFASPSSNVTDGDDMNISFVLGSNSEDGKGNITVYAGYRSTNALLQSERDFSACSLNQTADGTGRVCGGSGTTSPALLGAIQQVDIPGGLGAGAGLGNFVTNPDGSLRPFGANDQFNFAPFNYYQRPDERYTAGLFAKYAVSDSMEVYTEFSFMNDETVAQIAPAGLFLGGGPGVGGGYLVNCDSPFLTSAQVGTFCTQRGLGPTDVASIAIGKRNVEGGGRQSALEHTSYRGVLGLRGEINDIWSYDGYGLFGTTEYAQTFFNDFSGQRATNALIAKRDSMGNIVCGINVDANPTNDDPNCVPYNPFTLGGITQDALNYIQVPGFQNGSTVEVVVSGSVSGDLSKFVKLPTAEGGLQVAFGAEYRSEESTLRNDSAFATGDLLGQGGATLDTVGSYNVREVFTEARLPILEDKPFARSVSVEAGYRYSDYDLGFDTDTYKFGADWAPVDDLRLRASFQRAVRAPNIQELFRPQVVQLDGSTDPCAGPVATLMFSAAQCALTGVSAAQFGFIQANPANQYNGLTGGNMALDPEISDTVSFGFVYTPGFLPNFTVTLDFFDIEVEDTIGTIGADLIINTCLTGGDPAFCSLINRAPGSGSLFLGDQGFIIDTTQNTGSLTTRGVDIDLNYVWKTDNVGDLRFSLIGTYLDELVTEPLEGFPDFDCVGLFGNVCGTPTPEFRSKFRTTWSTPWNLDVSLTWRYLDAVDNEGTEANPNFNAAFPQIDGRLSSRSYFDLSASYGVKTEIADLKVRLGIDNLTDKDPPVVTSSTCVAVFCSGNTFPQVYEALGRTFMFNVTTDF